MSKRELRIFADKAELAAALGPYINTIAADAIAQRNKFSIALSGGSMPKVLAMSNIDATHSKQWIVLMSDERYVAADSPLSNSKANRDAFLNTAVAECKIIEMQYYGIEDDDADDNEAVLSDKVAAAAADYEKQLRDALGEQPQVDLVLLGMGEDGHTASLFPGHALLRETTRLIAPIVDSPKAPPERVTFTLPLINAARNVAFIATGAGKQAPLKAIFGDDECALPAALVAPSSGAVQWFVDSSAAEQLAKE